LTAARLNFIQVIAKYKYGNLNDLPLKERKKDLASSKALCKGLLFVSLLVSIFA
jgi:hypothetical protein